MLAIGLNLMTTALSRIRKLIEQNLKDSTGTDLADSGSVQLVVNEEE